ncbi:hypothetical protein HPB48_004190 [Haemaphysalis longicornis]|uniref:Tc1-like transposase DDE domain-containing protein n=1 Tax=Haemaphysalis longicornis TaxID=44386 RepID=A0A9J6GL23_HAELO|nr:hypothetical protein HPB48_004190 [Haemaphysalis longicornis]
MSSRTATLSRRSTPYALDGPFQHGLCWLQHDRSPVHTARMAETTLHPCGVPRLSWTPSRTDLNPMENVWGVTYRRLVGRNLRVPKADALWDIIQEAWEALSAEREIVRALNESMPRRMGERISAEGNFAGY